MGDKDATGFVLVFTSFLECSGVVTCDIVSTIEKVDFENSHIFIIRSRNFLNLKDISSKSLLLNYSYSFYFLKVQTSSNKRKKEKEILEITRPIHQYQWQTQSLQYYQKKNSSNKTPIYATIIARILMGITFGLIDEQKRNREKKPTHRTTCGTVNEPLIIRRDKRPRKGRHANSARWIEIKQLLLTTTRRSKTENIKRHKERETNTEYIVDLKKEL